MTKITIDIDKPYNDKNIALAAAVLEDLPIVKKRYQVFRRSSHDRIHIDLYLDNELDLPAFYDFKDYEDLFFIVIRLAAGDDIRRLRTDAKKFFKGEDIFHWLPSKDDYRKVAEREK